MDRLRLPGGASNPPNELTNWLSAPRILHRRSNRLQKYFPVLW